MQSATAEKSSTELSREPLFRTEHPSPEAIWIFGGQSNPQARLAIVCEGRQYNFTVNRRQIMRIAEQVFEALKNMEPGR